MRVSSSPKQLSRAAERAETKAREAQGTVEGKTMTVKILESSATTMRTALAAEKAKASPDPKAVAALEGSLAKLTGKLDHARAELEAAQKEATKATKAATQADAKAIEANAGVIAKGAQLHKDEFEAKTTAQVLDTVGDGTHAAVKGFAEGVKQLEKRAKDPALTPAERQEAKDALPKMKDALKALKASERKLEKAEAAAEAKARKAGRKADALDPQVAEAKAALQKEVQGLIGVNVGNVVSQVGAAKAEAHAQLVNDTRNTPNADRAMETLHALDANPSPRVTPDIQAMLVKGVAESRTADANGHEGILGKAHATRAAEALAGMPDAQYAKITQALKDAGSPAEQALILKAVAARKDALTGPKTGQGAVAMMNAQDEITNFASRIRGMNRADLVQQTSVLDLDSQTNSSSVNPQNLTNNGYGPADTADNDGLFQHLTQSCAPTTAQMLKSEADPVFALALNDAGLSGINSNSAVTKGQQDALTKAGGNAIDRMTEAQIKDWRATLMRDTKNNTNITTAEADAAWKVMTNGGALKSNEVLPAVRGLQKMRAANNGSPTNAELTTMKMAGQKGTHAPTVISDMTEGVTGERLAERDTKLSFLSPVAIGLALPDVEARLKAGHDVPMGVGAADGKSGHVVLLSDVRGAGMNADYLVSDPSSGRTGWVAAKKLMNDPSWMNTFGLGGYPQVTGFLID